MTLGGSFIVCTVYRSSKRFPTELGTCRWRGLNCWVLDSPVKIALGTLCKSPSNVLLRNGWSFHLHCMGKTGFLAGLHDFKPKSLTKRLHTVLAETYLWQGVLNVFSSNNSLLTEQQFASSGFSEDVLTASYPNMFQSSSNWRGHYGQQSCYTSVGYLCVVMNSHPSVKSRFAPS